MYTCKSVFGKETVNRLDCIFAQVYSYNLRRKLKLENWGPKSLKIVIKLIF